MFNNCVPIEFVDVTSPNYIDTSMSSSQGNSGGVLPFKVLSRDQWSDFKKEMLKIKHELSQLYPNNMFNT
jgi:hypothetical protein